VAYLSGVSLSLGATAAGVLTAVLIGWASRRQQLREDTAIGIVFTGMFALGVVILSRAKTTRNLADILLGNVLAVTPADLWLIGGVTVGVAVVLFLLHKELELTSFDPTHAAAVGLSPDRLRFVLLVLLALTVVTAIQVVGLILTTALLVTPAATASLVTTRLSRTMPVAAALAVGSAVTGLLLSYHLRVPSGAAIVLTAAAAFVVTSVTQHAVRRRLGPSPVV
jgi:manganese/iron transport system permease protein